MQNNQNDNAMCPSFNSYSSSKLAEIASKVADEFKLISDHNTFLDDDDEFEFSLQLSSDEINNHGPVFPIFNRNYKDDNHEDASKIILPLKNLFLQETEASQLSSSSSSEADELESIPPGTYCVWRPKDDVVSSPTSCKKSKSTGSASKRFRIRDLIKRSNSEGKASSSSLVFLTPKKDKLVDEKLRLDSGKSAGKSRAPASPASSAHETFYMQNRAMKEGEKRKSYLPYRKDLVGFFANVNGLGKAAKPLPPPY
ncbi:DUF1645 domain-containing protein [Heracleum sosnowskyi]|uniref:DUF1645 domain-containing protein n=1 Tax=Heracleum sosnowskyi TaxID=360622 RepID=A0AAD8H3F7_9APIA|nr:DUF1645 domain-containing protein [Heracleum sosnowskyi]